MNNLWVIMLLAVGAVFSACRSGSGHGALSPGDKVTIDIPPGDQTVIEGQTAVFQVSASGAAPLSYQWRRDGGDIAGATGATYQTQPVSAGDDGAQFTVRVSNAAASVESNTAVLHVYSETNIPSFTEYTIDVTATDSAIDTSYGQHYAAINPNVSPKNKLFVFFPGSTAKPSDYRLIVRAAANNGFHAVGLPYPNGLEVYAICAGTNDPACPGQAHQEILTGQGGPAGFDVSDANSIENRLRKLLLYLSQQHPDQKWEQFLGVDNSILWSSVRVAGHSQGGAQAGFIGKQYSVDRVSFFSSPHDKITNQLATWITASGPTDPSRYFGFSSLQDGIIPWTVIQQNWPALHMDDFGGYVDADSSAPPYDDSHMLSTNLSCQSGYVCHCITVVDFYTPRDGNGLPTYRNVWQYLGFL